jgi:hypothetical protein
LRAASVRKADRWPSRAAGRAVSEALGQTPRVLTNKQPCGPHAPFRASQLTLAIVESAIAEIAGSGSPKATSTNSGGASEALRLFISDTVACPDVMR